MMGVCCRRPYVFFELRLLALIPCKCRRIMFAKFFRIQSICWKESVIIAKNALYKLYLTEKGLIRNLNKFESNSFSVSLEDGSLDRTGKEFE